jgi:hypothetical protein
MPAVHMLPAIIADVAASGLTPNDMDIRPISGPELAAANVSSGIREGYVIPYFDINGQPTAFYRLKLLNHDPKYKQPKGTLNHVYYPKTFLSTLNKLRRDLNGYKAPFVIITEGEKKAASAVKHGFPAIGLGGVDSWRNRAMLISREAKITTSGDNYYRIPIADRQEIEDLAEGFKDLIEIVVANRINVIICYDSDTVNTSNEPIWKPEVQRAAATLAFELRHQGLPSACIRQLILPSVGTRKTGLDDYLNAQSGGPQRLQSLIERTLELRNVFPRHPQIRHYISKNLEHRLSRRDRQEISFCVLSELDARGRRLQSTANNAPYYFDEQTYKLMPALFMSRQNEYLYESPFGKFLYQEYGLGGSDNNVLSWLASQFTGEEPIDEVEPRRVNALGVNEPDSVNLQLSDSRFVSVTKDGIRVKPNGSDGILFEQDQVEPVDIQRLEDEIARQLKEPLKPYWLEATYSSSIMGDRQKVYAALLCYLSPWLNRWRGLQIPLEIFYGEAGSGKSSLFMLRLSILTGRPILRNIPSDMRDWYAGITSSGGIYVIDNVQFADKALRQRLSDEMCRLITEPDPHVEMRKLYTTNSQAYLPVRTTFGFTAIQQPFLNADLIQRAAIFHMEKHKNPAGNWVENQLSRHGREGWLAHHLIVLHKFLDLCLNQGAWSADYPTSNRLAHYEHCLRLMAKTLGLEHNWIAEELNQAVLQQMSEADWTLEAIKEFTEIMWKVNPNKRYTAHDICEWAQSDEEYSDNQTLVNARRLGRYMQSHKVVIEQTTGLFEVGKIGNRQHYGIKAPKTRKTTDQGQLPLR